MKQKFLFLMTICSLIGSMTLQTSDFDDTPALILFIASS